MTEAKPEKPPSITDKAGIMRVMHDFGLPATIEQIAEKFYKGKVWSREKFSDTLNSLVADERLDAIQLSHGRCYLVRPERSPSEPSEVSRLAQRNDEGLTADQQKALDAALEHRRKAQVFNRLTSAFKHLETDYRSITLPDTPYEVEGGSSVQEQLSQLLRISQQVINTFAAFDEKAQALVEEWRKEFKGRMLGDRAIRLNPDDLLFVRHAHDLIRRYENLMTQYPDKPVDPHDDASIEYTRNRLRELKRWVEMENIRVITVNTAKSGLEYWFKALKDCVFEFETPTAKKWRELAESNIAAEHFKDKEETHYDTIHGHLTVKRGGTAWFSAE
jgi:hypothetical protein